MQASEGGGRRAANSLFNKVQQGQCAASVIRQDATRGAVGCSSVKSSCLQHSHAKPQGVPKHTAHAVRACFRVNAPAKQLWGAGAPGVLLVDLGDFINQLRVVLLLRP